ncbi:PucR family transcriptional regulator [Mycobacterium sp. 852002-51163_SCH5372311]|nr:helix-turn-helix domain-containing protein [Mycobacterium sp. 852002-51163_SCH5372311]OBF82631.1 PucR family transcriptional regulator [Mycobacterium sp. 852002-51163_SCH5372311]
MRSISALPGSPKPRRYQPVRPDAGTTWAVLVGALLDEHADVAGRVREAVAARVPAYRAIPGEALDAEVRLEVERVLRCACAALDERELVELAAIGEARARDGIFVDDMLRAWRIGVEVVVGCAREAAQDVGVDDSSVLEFVQSVLAWSDVAMVTTARAHRRAELALALAADESRAAFVRGALLGALPAAELRMHAEVYGLDTDAEYVAVRARLGDDGPQFRMEQALGFQDPAQGRPGLCALVDGDLAGFLIEPPRQVEGVVGFGPPRPLLRLNESYRMAARALVTAEACGLRGAYDIATLGLRTAVAMDADVGELLRKRYLQPLSASGSSRDLVATLRTYLACGMHVERTAARLFVHQNTVRYRLARFEELTGASLRDTEVLTEVWWVLELSSMHV